MQCERRKVAASQSEMANPSGHVVLDEEAAHTAQERYATLEAELQALRAQNEELTRGLQEREEVLAAERLWGNSTRTSTNA